MITNLSDFHSTWAERFNARDLDGMLELGEEGAAFVPQPGNVISQAEDVRAALEWFLSLNAPISIQVRHVIETGDIGLVIADWQLSGTAPDGAPVELKGSTADVVRRGAEGWKLVIDNPFGTA
jgi:ketosteroid isomerase-like protein